jgi:MFS family permease
MGPVTRSTDRPGFTGALALVSASTLVSMVAYAAPLGNAVTLTRAFAVRAAGTTWILSSMSLGLAVAMLGAGVLADEVGRRRVFRVGAAVFALGSVACTTATFGGPGTATAVFVGGRVVEGVGAAGMIATGLGLVASLATDDHHRTAASRWWAVAMGAGIALGPVLAGLFDEVGATWWPATYWLLAAVGVVVAGAGGRLLPEVAATRRRRLDVVGLALLTVGLCLLLVALVEARGGSVTAAWATGVGGVVVLALLVLSQMWRSTTLVERDLLRGSDFRAANLAALVCGLGVIAIMSFSCTYLTRALGITTLQAGLLLCLWSGTSALAALAARSLLGRLPGNRQLAAGLGGVGVGIALLTAVVPGSPVWQVVPGMLVAGVASGVLNAGLARQAVASVPPDRAAMGTGANNTMRYVGSSLGVTFVSVVALGAADISAGWTVAAWVCAVVSVAGAVGVVLLGRTTSGQRPSATPTG